MSQIAPTILSGKVLADRILAAGREQVAKLRKTTQVIPGFAVVLVGGDELAARYFERKRLACADLGIVTLLKRLPGDTTTAALVQELTALGNNDSVDGILLQYPLPAHLDGRAAFDAIPPGKDVDITTSTNLAHLQHQAATNWPCVVESARLVLQEYSPPVADRSALVIGSGDLVASPLALLLTRLGARVTRADADDSDLRERVATADIVATVIGRAEFIRTEWLKRGVMVIDTGLNPGPAGTVVGDVAATAGLRAAYVTPVPGGLGKLTLALLIERTIRAARRRADLL
ncbi:MAG: Bifunctional protein FolD 1 [Verrucomicrobiota bacterium]|jgi:methylenetetrahydrofolate dehydrogenase (NADP+)/methenyltetrahydrofolate cyclohydrolase